jgi:hypothetical protein
MPIGSESLRDQRRRRVLKDVMDPETEVTDSSANESDSPSRTQLEPHSPRYAPAARVEHHLPISALIPKTGWLMALIVLLAGLGTVLLNVFNWQADQWCDTLGASAVAPLDLRTLGGVSKWASSMLLAGAAFYGLQIFILRRYRSDDYRGTYRVWPWLIAILLMASLDATADLRLLVISLLSHYAESKVSMSPWLWHFIWLAPCALALFRLGLEVKQSVVALMFIILAAVSYGYSYGLHTRQFQPPMQLEASVVKANLIFLGHLLVFLTVTSYARFVFLDAQGVYLARFAAKSAKKDARYRAKQDRRNERKAKAQASQQEREEKLKLKEQQKQELAVKKAAEKQAAAELKAAAASSKQAQAQTKSESAVDKKATTKTTPAASQAPVSSKKPESNVPPPSKIIQPLRSNATATSTPTSTSRNDLQDAEIEFNEVDDEENESQLSRSELKRLKKMQKRDMRRAA